MDPGALAAVESERVQAAWIVPGRWRFVCIWLWDVTDMRKAFGRPAALDAGMFWRQKPTSGAVFAFRRAQG